MHPHFAKLTQAWIDTEQLKSSVEGAHALAVEMQDHEMAVDCEAALEKLEAAREDINRAIEHCIGTAPAAPPTPPATSPASEPAASPPANAELATSLGPLSPPALQLLH